MTRSIVREGPPAGRDCHRRPRVYLEQGQDVRSSILDVVARGEGTIEQLPRGRGELEMIVTKTRRGFGLFAGVSEEVVRATAENAEALGYDSFWVNYPGPVVDGLARLGVAAKATRTIKLGVGVIPLTTRPAASIVEGVTAHLLPADRLLLGIGSSNPGGLSRVRAGVAALREVFPSPRFRIVVAALGPKMCRLAGEVADGVLFNWLTPEHARISGGWVREGAAAAGRPEPTLYAYVRGALGVEAMDRLTGEGARYASIPAYADHFARMGRGPLETSVRGADAASLHAQLAAWDGAVDEVVVRALTASDTVEQTLALLRAVAPDQTSG